MKEKLVQMFHGSTEILIDWGNLKQIFLSLVIKILRFDFIQGLIEAVKVWQFKKKEESMFTKFKAMEPGRFLFSK